VEQEFELQTARYVERLMLLNGVRVVAIANQSVLAWAKCNDVCSRCATVAEASPWLALALTALPNSVGMIQRSVHYLEVCARRQQLMRGDWTLS
jgi:hypothetical protein